MKHNLIELESRLFDNLPEETQVWGHKFRELDYFEMDNEKHIRPREFEGMDDFHHRPKQTSNLTFQVINELGKQLYNPGPFRSIKNSDVVDAFYQDVIHKNCLNAKMQRADELSTLHGLFAIQVAPGDTTEKPLKLYPWMATEVFTYAEDDDPNEIWAVLTRSLFPQRRQIRYQLWSADEVRSYYTRPGDIEALPRGAGRQLEFDEQESGPHGLGCLPFVFIKARPSVTSIYEGALGPALVRVNHTLDVKLSDMAQAIQQYAIPRQYALHLSPNSSYSNIPGNPTHLVGDSTGVDPKLFFLQPNLNVADSWTDINNTIERTLFELDIPLQVNSNHSTPESGQALLVRRMSMTARTAARTPSFVEYETDLARMILQVAGNLQVDANHAEYLKAATELELECTFPSPNLPVTEAEKNLSDQFMLDMNLKSKIQILQERRGVTREAAIQMLKEIAEDNKIEAELGLTPGSNLKPLPVSPNPQLAALESA